MRKDGDDSRERAYALVQEFIDAFRERRTLLCRELLGVDVNTPEGIAEVRKKDLFRRVCPKFVKDSAKILDSLL